MSTLLYFDKKKKIAYLICKGCEGTGVYTKEYCGMIETFPCVYCKGKKYIEIKIEDKKYLQCEECGKRDETVEKIECGYQLEINNKHVFEVICDACEQEHLNEI